MLKTFEVTLAYVKLKLFAYSVLVAIALLRSEACAFGLVEGPSGARGSKWAGSYAKVGEHDIILASPLRHALDDLLS